MFSNTERHILKCRRACSQIQKGMFSNAERHVLKYRKAPSSFLIRTHCIHVGAKQIYIKIKYSSPSHAFHSPHPFPFHPHSTLFPSPAHSPLSVTPRTCSSVTLSPLATNLFTRPPVNSSTCNVTHRTCSSVTLSPLATNLFPCPLVNPSTYNVTHRTCSSVTLSLLAYYLFPRLPVNPSTYNVTLRTCSPVTMSINTTNLFPCPLVNPSSCKLFLSSYFFVGTCLKHCNANSSLFVTNIYRQKHNYQ